MSHKTVAFFILIVPSIFLAYIQEVNAIHEDPDPYKVAGTWYAIAWNKILRVDIPCMIYTISVNSRTSFIRRDWFAPGDTLEPILNNFTTNTKKLFPATFQMYAEDGSIAPISGSMEIFENYSPDYTVWRYYFTGGGIVDMLMSRLPIVTSDESRIISNRYSTVQFINNTASAGCPSPPPPEITSPTDPFDIIGVWHVVAVSDISILPELRCWIITISIRPSRLSFNGTSTYDDNITQRIESSFTAEYMVDRKTIPARFQIIMTDDRGSTKNFEVELYKTYLYNFVVWRVFGHDGEYYLDLVVSRDSTLSHEDSMKIRENFTAPVFINHICESHSIDSTDETSIVTRFSQPVSPVSTLYNFTIVSSTSKSSGVSKPSISIEDSEESTEKHPDYSLLGNISRTLGSEASRPSISIILFLFWFLYLCFN